MSLLPYLLDDPVYFRPTTLLGQHFGSVLGPVDFLQPYGISGYLTRSRAGYLRNWAPSSSKQDVGSVVSYDKDKFQANLNVQQFKPEEISVKVTGDNTITVEGKHEEKPDEHGHIYRHFVRKYVLPKGCDINRVESKLSSDGVLSITALKVEDEQIQEKSVLIAQTGQPVKQIEKK